MDTIKTEDCSLIIPACAEKSHISGYLPQLSEFSGEIIFVCGDSDKTRDITSDIIEEFYKTDFKSDSNQNVKILRLPDISDRKDSIIAGMKAASKEYIGYTDADGTVSVSEMTRLFKELETCDCAIGSRWLKKSAGPKNQSFFGCIKIKAFNRLVKKMLDIPFQDSLCGTKVFRKSALDSALPQASAHDAFDAEILYILYSGGFMIKEIPIAWNETEYSHAGGFDAAEMLKSLRQIRRGREDGHNHED